MSCQAVISSAVAPIYREPAFNSEMINQSLMWENVKIEKKEGNWYQIRMADGYNGWIHSFYLHHRDPAPEEYTFITARTVPVFYEKYKLHSIAALLSFGTRLPMSQKSGDFCKVHLPDGQAAYMKSQEQIVKKSRKTIIDLAKSLLGVPYLWGGKSSFGYDCSGFVQMVLKTAGIDIQRDTSQQIQTESLEEIQMDDVEPGDLLFFAENNHINHVAFILGEGKIIHCSGQVKIESIVEGEPGFSKQLSLYEKTEMSISALISS